MLHGFWVYNTGVHLQDVGWGVLDGGDSGGSAHGDGTEIVL